MPTPSGERVLSARVPYPDTVVQGRTSDLAFELVRDGVVVIPHEVSKVQVVDRAGSVLFQDVDPTVAAGRATTSVPGSTSSAWIVGELFQVRWHVVEVEGQDAKVYRRPAVVAKFKLSPPITDDDLTGVYPDLVDQLAEFAETGENGEATLQPYIDDAWNFVLRKLFKVNRWPDLLFSVEDLVDPVREKAWENVFRFLYLRTGEGGRFEPLWREHRDNAKTEWDSMSARFDEDGDGLPESEDRDSISGVVHANPAPRRRLSRRW